MVIEPMNGATMSGASVCPTKVFAAVASVSEPDVFMVLRMIQAKPRTSPCIQPR